MVLKVYFIFSEYFQKIACELEDFGKYPDIKVFNQKLGSYSVKPIKFSFRRETESISRQNQHNAKKHY
jgi:hypothetical protein